MKLTLFWVFMVSASDAFKWNYQALIVIAQVYFKPSKFLSSSCMRPSSTTTLSRLAMHRLPYDQAAQTSASLHSKARWDCSSRLQNSASFVSQNSSTSKSTLLSEVFITAGQKVEQKVCGKLSTPQWQSEYSDSELDEAESLQSNNIPTSRVMLSTL